MEGQGIEIARAFVSVEPDMRKLEAGFAAGDAQAKAFARSVGASTGKVASTATADAAKVASAWTSAGKSVQSAGATMVAAGKKTSSVGTILNKSVTLPLVAIGAVAGKLSLDFGRSMQEIGTQAGASTKEVRYFKREVERLGAKGRYAQGPKELSEALFDIRSTGIKGAQAMKALAAASDLATVGNADLESTTSGLVGVLRTGIKGAGSMQAAIGTLNATIGAGKMHMEDLNAAIGTGFLGSAKGLGVSLGGVGAALAELTSQGVPANSAATRLRMTMSLLANPTEKAADVLQGIGIGSEDLAKKMRASGSLIPALEELQEHMKGLSQVQQGQLLSSAFGGAKSGGTIIQLLGQLDDLGEKQKQIFENTKEVGKAIDEANSDPAVKFQKVWSALQFDLIKIGNVLIPALEPVIMEVGMAIAGVAETFDSLSPTTKSWAVKVALVAIALGPVLSLTGKIMVGIGKLVTLGGRAAEAIGGVVAADAAGADAATAAAADTIAANTAAADSYGVLGAAAEAAAGMQTAAAAEASTAQLSMAVPEAAGAGGQMSLLAMPAKAAPAVESAGVAAIGGGEAAGAGAAAGGAGIAEAGAAASVAAPEVMVFVAAIAAVGAGLVLLYKHSGTFRDEVGQLGAAAGHAFGEIEEQIKPIISSVKSVGQAIGNSGVFQELIHLENGFGDIADFIKSVFVNGVKGAFARAAQTIEGFGQIFAGQIQVVRGVVEVITGILTLDFDKAWKGVKNIFGGGLRAVLGIMKVATAPFREAAVLIGGVLSDTFGKAWDKVTSVFEDGVSAVVGIVNAVIDVLNHIPGVDIGHVGGSGDSGGGKTKMTKQEKTRGYFTGGQITEPRAIVGEQAPAHNEWVIATNPAYRDQNLEYWRRAGRDLGVPGFAGGGLMGGSDFTGGAQRLGLSIPNPISVAGEAAGAVGGAVSGAASSIAGDVVGAGASKFIGMLPTPNLPEPFSGVGPYLIGEVTKWIKDGFQSHKIGQLSLGAGALGFTGAPANMKQLGDNAYVDSHTLAVTASLDKMFGLTMSSGYRSPAHNAEIGGAPGSLHTHGSSSNPGATDSVGSESAMAAYIAFAKKHVAGLQEAFVDNYAGLGDNAHIGFFGQGGLLTAGGPAALSKATGKGKGKGKGKQKGGGGKFGGGGAGGILGAGIKRLSTGSIDASSIKSSGVLSPEEWAAAMLVGGFPSDAGVISEGLGTIKSESSFDSSQQAQGAGGHIGGWAESPDFGSADHRLSPIGSSTAAHKEWETDGHSFWQAWGQWEQEQSGISGGGAKAYGPEYVKVAEHVIGKGVTGSAGAKSETVPGMFHGAHTHSLSFGGIPKSLPGIEKEIRRWEGELKTYRHAAKAADGKPKTQQAIQANVTAIEKHLKELRHARAQERRKAAQKKFTKRITGKLGKLTGFETDIAGKERSYEIANQFAEQLVDQEPLQPELPDSASEAQREASEQTFVQTLKSYIDTKERPAYARVLERENDWRNTILGGESKATGMETGWEGRIVKLEAHIKSINDFSDQVAKDVATFRKAHPHADLPDKLKNEEKKRAELLNKLPMMRFKEGALRGTLGEAREEFYGGVDKPVHPPLPPLAGTGNFEEALKNVQGVHWPDQHGKLPGLPALPEAGQFGGAIWDTQTSIQELGLKVPSAGGGGGGGGGLSEAEQATIEAAKKIVMEDHERDLVAAVQKPILDAFKAMPPFGGSFATGGEVPGPPGAARTVIAHGGETITPAGASSSGTVVYVIIEDGAVDPDKIRIVAEDAVDVRLQRGGRSAGRGMPGGAGGRFAPGA